MGVVSAAMKFAGVDVYQTAWAQSNGGQWLALVMYVLLCLYFIYDCKKAKVE